MSDVRCLHRGPGFESAPRTRVAPQGVSRDALDARETLGQFLDAVLLRPLWFDDNQQEQRVNAALETMTLAERITIEIEMQSRNAAVHSVEYDPLR